MYVTQRIGTLAITRNTMLKQMNGHTFGKLN